jgi:thiopeptide-type bacteriocin biosynthesis protein
LFYRSSGAALLRAAAASIDQGPGWWPDLDDLTSCQNWLSQVWSLPGFADEVWHSSRALAAKVETMLDYRRPTKGRDIRRACTSVMRYLLRATGRPTPFGLFAGVAPASLAESTVVCWGTDHRPVARVDTQWLADVVDQLEAMPDLLECLDVQFSDLARVRGKRIETPFGPERSSVRYTKAVQEVHETTTSPVTYGVLAARLRERFPGGNPESLHALLTGLIRQGLLITNLRAPFTVIDPLHHVIGRLETAGAHRIAAAASILTRLQTIHAALDAHNRPGSAVATRQHREEITAAMAELSTAGRCPLSVDLVLDCEMQIPTHVADEMQHAASVMLRLSRRPFGDAAWHDFHTRFLHRYDTGALVPVTEVTDLDSGLGFPASYLGSVAAVPIEPATRRDQLLLGLAMQAVADGTGEVVLTENMITALTEDNGFDGRHFPAQVELAARIQAASADALTAGDYTLVVTPARSAGTLTCRFTPLSTGSGLDEVYRSLPVTVADALPVQMSFPPAYPHGENVCRIPAYLPHVLRFGEHHVHDPAVDIAMNDLAIYATSERLHLVSVSRNQVIEPQVLHALALQKQPPPIVRFLAHLARGFSALWTEVDWGPHCHELPFLPRLRYRRTVIFPARWQLVAGMLPGKVASAGEWNAALNRWRSVWRCPDVVELREDDRTLRVDFTVPAHLALVREHLDKQSKATLTEAPRATGLGWAGGHVHEIAIPFVTCRPPAPSPLIGVPPVIGNAHGHSPGAPGSRWLQLKLHTHPERFDQLIYMHLPELRHTIDGDLRIWFVRYRSPWETPHLRVRLHIPDHAQFGSYAAAVGQWTQRLRQQGIVGDVVIDTYRPEVGRYGDGPAMQAAEDVFVADSDVVAALLRHRDALGMPAVALGAVSMISIVEGFLGGVEPAMHWFTGQVPTSGPSIDRILASQVLALARSDQGWHLPTWPDDVTAAWAARAHALATYSDQVLAGPDVARVLESLLHMHHNRLIGIDPGSERDSRRLARQAALAWATKQDEAR